MVKKRTLGSIISIALATTYFGYLANINKQQIKTENQIYYKMINPFNLPEPEELEKLCKKAEKKGALIVHGYSLRAINHEDVIYHRIEKAVELFREGNYNGVIFAGGGFFHGVTEAEILAQRFTERLDELNIIHPKKILKEEKSETSYQNAWNTKKMVEEEKYKQLTVISARYFLPRAYLIYNRVYNKTPVDVYFMGSDEKISPGTGPKTEKAKAVFEWFFPFSRL